MRLGIRRWASTTLVVSTFVFAATAQAGVALVTTRATLGSDVIDWGKTTGGPIPVGFVSNDGLVGMTTSAGGDLQVRQQPGNFNGNFTDGESLEFTGFHGPDITLNFTTAVAGAGAQIQANFPNAFVARITASDGVRNWSFTENGSSNGKRDGSAIFIGVLSNMANLKTVSFALDSASFLPNSFAINQVSLTDTVGGVPEPSSWALLTTGFGLVGVIARFRRTVITAQA